MRKAYIQPEAELLSLALLEDFLTASSDNSDITAGDSNSTENNPGGAGDGWIDNENQTPGVGGGITGGNEFEDGGSDNDDWK